MSIPTRSHSLREPRKQAPSPVQTSTTKSISATTTSTTRTPSTTTERPDKDASVSSRRKTLSSHRNSLQYGQTQYQESRLPPGGTTQQGQDSSANRRQSLGRPSALKPALSIRPPASTNKNATTHPSVVSPGKREIPRDTPQKNTDMPPPPRPRRSASVRQPASSSSTTPVSAKGHMRHRSQQVIPATRQTPKKIEPPSPASVQRQRTHFNTYQPPLSPRKPAKPAPNFFPDADSSTFPSSWPEIAALQTEMLQLSLLHSSSVQKNAECQAEAENNLRGKYESVAEAYRAILADEREHQRRLNNRALNLWLKNSHERKDRQGFPEQIQLLSQVAQEVSDLSDNEGRYTLAVREFETWLQNADEVRKSRSHHETSITTPITFIDPLGHTWKEELDALTMNIELCSRQLESLDILGYGEMERLEGSALPRIAQGLKDMTDMMIREIRTIRDIEADIVKSERTWVSQFTARLVASQRPSESGTRVGIWKMGKP